MKLKKLIRILTHTTRCLLNYLYINDIDIESLVEGDQAYQQANSTWNIVSGNQNEDFNDSTPVRQVYSDKSYMYCIALWNCAQQILLNEIDVYNDTFGDFVEGMDRMSIGKSTFGDERTQALFILIAQLGDFRVI
ncbi:hypothetical protein [Pedobacter sp. JCM 36344]|uniref:hypothetical protein n=1 Tax=Pedobacter sp. JCM 36344 TaxID=3374280 RepID=UPI003979B532